MTIEELIRWRGQNAAAVAGFQRKHRELGGIHFMPGDAAGGNGAGGAHVEFVLKLEGDTADLERDIRAAFPGLPFRIVVLDPETDFLPPE